MLNEVIISEAGSITPTITDQSRPQTQSHSCRQAPAHSEIGNSLSTCVSLVAYHLQRRRHLRQPGLPTWQTTTNTVPQWCQRTKLKVVVMAPMEKGANQRFSLSLAGRLIDLNSPPTSHVRCALREPHFPFPSAAINNLLVT